LEALLSALEGTSIAQTLRGSRWLYAAVNAGHVAGIALLVGAIVPLDLRLLGAWRGVPRAPLIRVLVPMAAGGLALAALTGALMFSIRAREYAGVGFLQLKLVLVATGIIGALALHRAYGLWLEGASEARLARHAALSLLCWPAALLCGRLIAFAGD
jgi:hypothetical protein